MGLFFGAETKGCDRIGFEAGSECLKADPMARNALASGSNAGPWKPLRDNPTLLDRHGWSFR